LRYESYESYILKHCHYYKALSVIAGRVLLYEYKVSESFILCRFEVIANPLIIHYKKLNVYELNVSHYLFIYFKKLVYNANFSRPLLAPSFSLKPLLRRSCPPSPPPPTADGLTVGQLGSSLTVRQHGPTGLPVLRKQGESEEPAGQQSIHNYVHCHPSPGCRISRQKRERYFYFLEYIKKSADDYNSIRINIFSAAYMAQLRDIQLTW
jgi:hypothetical protein